MKKAKTFIIPMLALAVFGMTACGGGEQSSSQPQSSSSGKASIPVDTIASVKIKNKDALKKEWILGTGSRALDIEVLDDKGNKLSETVLIGTGDLKVSSSDESVIDTIGAGLYAKKEGKATITVKIQDKSDSVELEAVEKTVNKLSDIDFNYKVDVTATVGAINSKGFVITDGTNAVYVDIGKKATDIVVGDVVNVKGTADQYMSDHGFINVSKNVTYSKTTGTATPMTATPMTKAIADGLVNGKNVAAVKLYTWDTTVGKSGNFLTYPFAGSDTVIEPVNADSAAAGTKDKEYTVTCFFAGYDSKYNYAAMILVSAVEKTYSAESVTISGPAEVRVGEPITLAASVLPAKAAQEVTWSSSNQDYAVVDENGQVVAKYDFAGGEESVQVTISATAANGVKGEKVIAVKPEAVAPITAFSLSKDEVTVAYPAEDEIVATITPQEGTKKAIEWTSSNPQIAKIEMREVEGVTKYIVVATGTGDATLTATTVGLDESGNPKQASVLVHATKATIVGAAAAFAERGEATSVPVSGLYAKVAYINNSNMVLDDGTTSTWAYCSAGTKPAEGDVIKITTGTMQSYNQGHSINFSEYEKIEDVAIEYSEAVEPEAASIENIYNESTKAENPEMVPVMSKVVFKDVEIKAQGGSGAKWLFDYGDAHLRTGYVSNNLTVGRHYDITGYVINVDGGVTPKLLQVIPTEVALTEGQVFIAGSSFVENGKTTQLTATMVGSPEEEFDWSSSDPEKATVDNTGKVTGIATSGKVTITATSKTDSSKSGSMVLDLVEASIATLTFPDDDNSGSNSYKNDWTAKKGDYTFEISHMSNNNNAWAYLKAGAKDKGDASIGVAIASKVDKVTITITDFKTTDAFAQLANASLKYGADKEHLTESVALNITEAGTFTADIPAEKEAENLYYQLAFSFNAATGTSKSNGTIFISKVVYK